MKTILTGLSIVLAMASTSHSATLSQTVQFNGVSSQKLYDMFLDGKIHGAMTADGTRPARFVRPSTGHEVPKGEEGDILEAFGVQLPDGTTIFALTARILQLVPGKLIVLSWQNFAWQMAVDPKDITSLDSVVTLTFHDNFAGSEIHLVHVNVPDYKVSIPDTGEVGPLSSIVNTHWSLLYWNPMKAYLKE